jgi:predicted neuraminidase
MCELKNEDLYAVWFSGSVEGAPDTAILGSRFSRAEVGWTDPIIIVDVPDHASGNPRVFSGPSGDLWLLFAINYGVWCHGGSRLFLKRSYDEGNTWSDMSIFWDQWGLLGKNKPLHLESAPSTWLIPVEWEDDYACAFFRSEDYGRTWNLTKEIGRVNNIRVDQPTVVELDDKGNLMAFMRSWEGYIYKSYSEDTGRTWTEPVPTDLLNNNSGIDMVRLRSGMLLLAHNPTALGASGQHIVDQALKDEPELQISPSEFAKDKNYYRKKTPKITDLYPKWGPRTPLRLSISADNGETWDTLTDLETHHGEFSYPAVIQTSRGEVCITYTYNRAYIKHVVIPLGLIERDKEA